MRHLHKKVVVLFFFSHILSIFILILLITCCVWLGDAMSGWVHTGATHHMVADSFIDNAPKIFAISIVLSIALVFLWAVLHYDFYRFSIGEEGFKKEYGIIRKVYTVIPYKKIQNIDIHRGIVERILGLSTLRIETAAGSGYPEGVLPGLLHRDAIQLRDDLLKNV